MTYTATIPAMPPMRIVLTARQESKRPKHPVIGRYLKRAQPWSVAAKTYVAWKEYIRECVDRAGFPCLIYGERCHLHTQAWQRTRRGADPANVHKGVEDAFNRVVWDDDAHVAGSFGHPRKDKDSPRVFVRLIVEDTQ